jgi:hypothetical protein
VTASARSRLPDKVTIMMQQRPTDTGNWDNEGGAIRPADVAPPRRGTRGVPPHRRQPRDTVAGCRDAAASDLVQAAAMDTANGRLRFEHSAASWTARGDLLQRLDDGWRSRVQA